jgi:hypothetical protein
MDVMDQLKFLIQVLSDFEDEKAAGVRGVWRLKIEALYGRNGLLQFFSDFWILDL